MPNQGLSDVMSIVYKTLHELNVDLEEINLKNRVPFYECASTREIADIIYKIQLSEACILATSVNMFAPTALMKAFLEHCTHPDYQSALMGKNYMTISVSSTLGERESAEYLYRVIGILGGAEISRIAIGGRDLSFMNSDAGIHEAIEKSVEDFYRLIRQNRRAFLSSEAYVYRNFYMNTPNITQSSTVLKPVYVQEAPIFTAEQKKVQPKTPNTYEPPVPDVSKEDFDEIKALLDNIRNKANEVEAASNPQFEQQPENTFKNSGIPNNNIQNDEVVEAYEAQFEAFAERQEADIKDITRMFAQKNSNDMDIPINNSVTYSRPSSFNAQDIVYREKTCKQMMMAMPHHFQSHLAAGLNTVFQFNISGEELFDAYLTIENSETAFYEGLAPKADIFIYTSSSVMKDILRGKYSAQKAFMTGQLKVRGNFVLLNKLDQLYKKMP